jgi:hypothetical protein
MTAHTDPDGIVMAWLDEGPTDLPDATRRAILTALPIAPQSRRRRIARWTLPPMNGFARLATAAIVALATVVSVVYIVRPLGVAGPDPSPTPTATTPPFTPTQTTSGLAPLHEGRLVPGRYSTTAFQPTLRFTLGDGWTARFRDDLDEIALDRPNQDFVAITRVSSVLDPGTGAVRPVPDDLMGWLSANPNYEWSGAPVPVEIAGLAGTMIEGHVKAGLAPTDTFAYDTGNMRITGGDRMRYYVLPFDGPDLTFVVAGRTDSGFAAAVAALEVLLRSLEIGPF